MDDKTGFWGPEDEINVLVLVKGEERYIFLYSDEQTGDAIEQLGSFASNKELSFTWYDAATLSQKIRLQHSKKWEE